MLSFAVACSSTTKATSSSQEQISYQYLMSNDDKVFPNKAFIRSGKSLENAPKNTFEGKLTITGTPSFKLNYGAISSLPKGHKTWPKFEVEFIQDNGRLIPVDRSHGFIGNGAWSITAGVGAVWDEATDEGFSRAAFPYTIKEQNANCEANGLATFLFKNDGSISNVHIQNVAETCKFYGFEFFGTLYAQYNKHLIKSKNKVIEQRNNEELGYLPTKPLTELTVDYPKVNIKNYGYPIPAESLNGYGLLVNGTNYISGCTTRYGEHPYCSEKTIGLYSFTKSIHAFMLVAAIEKKHPGFKKRLIKHLVPECHGSQWNDVNIEHALDMTTGNYQSPVFHSDESSSEIVKQYFLQSSRQSRASFACNGWQRKVTPGTYSVYHTTDTELVGYAASKYLSNKLGREVDAFNEVLVPLFNKLNLSQYIQGTQRTSDTNEAWGGYGLSATVNDVMRIALYLRDQAIADNSLDKAMLEEVLSGKPQGLAANVKNLNYDNGFWRLHVGKNTKMSVCGETTQVPMMSGFGGHTLILLPEVIVAQFTDSGQIGITKTIDDIFMHISDRCP